MKVFITCPGDRSVGIPDSFGSMEIEGTEMHELLVYLDEENPSEWIERSKEACREKIQELWVYLMGEQVQVRFEDECPDCGAEFAKEGCLNKNCISNIPEED